MKKQYHIVAVGECLIDFVAGQHGDMLLLEGYPGGAPANVLSMAARLGLSTAMIAKVGQDSFGAFLRGQLAAAGIGTETMVMGPDPTTLAIVSLDETGNRSFGFYRNGTADVGLTAQEVDMQTVTGCRIFHFGSVSMTTQPSRNATLEAAKDARQAGVLTSYDPNLRVLLWPDLKTAKDAILDGMELADLVKVSGEELTFLTGENDPVLGTEALYTRYHPKLLMVTLGPDGCICRTRQGLQASAAFDVTCVDTTGAGDAFWGATLYQILNAGKDIEEFTSEEITSLMDFSNAAGSLTTTHKGAIPAMPDFAGITACINTVPRCKTKAWI